jgi:hypothetical protein
MSAHPFHPELGRELARLHAQEFRHRADAWRRRRGTAWQPQQGGRRWLRLQAQAGRWLVALGRRLARGDLARQPQPLALSRSGNSHRR